MFSQKERRVHKQLNHANRLKHNRPAEERQRFNDHLQVLDAITPRRNIIILRNLYARIGNKHVPGIMQRSNEHTENNNGHPV